MFLHWLRKNLVYVPPPFVNHTRANVTWDLSSKENHCGRRSEIRARSGTSPRLSLVFLQRTELAAGVSMTRYSSATKKRVWSAGSTHPPNTSYNRSPPRGTASPVGPQTWCVWGERWWWDAGGVVYTSAAPISCMQMQPLPEARPVGALARRHTSTPRPSRMPVAQLRMHCNWVKKGPHAARAVA